MKIFKKGLSLLLCIAIVFSCSATVSAAGLKENNKWQNIFNKEETTEFSYSLKYHTDKDDTYGIDNILDKVDAMLAEKNYSVTVNITILFTKIPITIDLSSVNAVCETIDRFANLLEYGTRVLRPLIGDLADLELSSWTKDLRRGAQDSAIVSEFIDLLYNNRELIRKLCDGTLDAGVFNETFNIDKFVGPDGIGGTIKKFIIGLVYEKDSAEFNSAYNTYKNDIDAFIYGDLLNKYAAQYLPGFTMNENSTVEDLICIAFGLVVEKYVKPIIMDIEIDTANSEYEALRKLHGLINLKGSTYDFSAINFDPNKSFLSQVNNVVGAIFTQLIPGYSWKSGNYDKISENIEGAFKYLGKASGLIENADALSFDEIVMQVVGILVGNVDLRGIGDGVTECENLEDMAKVALINLTKNLGLDLEYTNDDSYLLVLGDVAAHYLYNWFSVKDLKGKALVPGMGYDIFEVVNFALNYILFDKSVGSFMGLSVSKTDDAFTKIDKILDYFGETKSKGVTFDSKKFILGQGQIKGLLDAIFSLDIQYIIEITAVPALKNAGNVSATKFIYNTVRYFINNWSGKQMIPAYTSGPFENALKNANVAKLIEYLAETMKTRNTALIKTAAFLGAMLLQPETKSLGEVTARVSDVSYTGGRVLPRATASLDGKTLTQGKDFVVVSQDTAVGPAKATVRGIGIYKGKSAELSFNILMGQIKNLTAKAQGDTVTLTWQGLDGITKYRVSYDGTVTETSETSFEIQTVLGHEYNFSVVAVSADGTESAPATVSYKARPGKVTGLKAADITANSFSLTWDASNGADKYTVEIYNSETALWDALTTIAETTTSVTELQQGKTYRLRVKAHIISGETTIGSDYSDELKVALKPAKVTGLEIASKTADSVKLTWDKTEGATHYAVYQIIDGTPTKLKTVKTTNYTVKGLAAGSQYTYSVRGYVSGPGYGEYSDTVSVSTALKKVTGLKVSKTSDSYIKLSWDKAEGATHYVVEMYKGGKWQKVKTLTGTSYAVKNLESCSSYRFRVKAYSTKLKAYSEYSDMLRAMTRVEQVTKLKSYSVKTTTLKLKWADVEGAEGYVVYYSTDNKTFKKYKSTDDNSITVKSLKAGKTYYFKVRAYNRDDNDKAVYGSYSSVLKVKTAKK